MLSVAWLTSVLLVQLAFIKASTARVGYASYINTMVTFGDSYSVQNVGGGRVQWPDWVQGYLNITLHDYAASGATCSNVSTPRVYPGVTENELPQFFTQWQNGSLGRLDLDKTVFTIWIGTNDV